MVTRSNWFTFVELIVAVTIMSILATIGFIAYTNQLWTTRDSRRISEITAINDALTSLSTKWAKYPLPTSSLPVTTAGSISNDTLVWYQWEFWTDLLKQIWFQNGWLDPKDGFPYIYFTNKDRRFAEVMAYLEDGSNLSLVDPLFPSAYAALSDYSTRFPKVVWKPLGIVIESSTKRSVHDIASIVTTWYFNLNAGLWGSYTVIFTDKDKLSWSGVNLWSKTPNKSCKRIRDVWGANGDGTYKINPLGTKEVLAYCDMTRDGGGWTLAMKNDGNSDSWALFTSRNTITEGYNVSNLLKNNFWLSSVFASWSATFSDTYISALYTEQFRVENNFGQTIYAKFNPWTSYDASVNYNKLAWCTYSQTASYILASSWSDGWNEGFGIRNSLYWLVPDLNVNGPWRFWWYWVYDVTCSWVSHTWDDFNTKVKVWVR